MKFKALAPVVCGCLSLLCGLAESTSFAQKEVWTDPKDPTLPKDFAIQGEYAGVPMDQPEGGAQVAPLGQVIALGDGHFQAVLWPGRLPGIDGDPKAKYLLSGQLQKDGSAKFQLATGNRKYLAQASDKFSATSQFPPKGHDDLSKAEATIRDGKMMVSIVGGAPSGNQKVDLNLKKIERKSETIGQKPPKGALVLFDGTDTEHWKGGRLDEKTGLLNTDGKDILTKKKFNDYTMHLEFLLPYRPQARGQGRGNSGFYQVDHYEVQILDSFGLDGKNNECGGVYQLADPKVNMCLPPLTWQTYDVDFTNAKTNEKGEVTEPARMTLKHNGVVIHEVLELKRKTGGSRNEPIGTPGPIKLQGHGNPLQFRNVWIVEK